MRFLHLSGGKKKSSDGSQRKKMTLRTKLLIALGSLLAVVVILICAAYGVFLHYYNKMNITSLGDSYELVTAIDYEEDELDENTLTDEERAQIDSLFNEDTYQNPDGTASGDEMTDPDGAASEPENADDLTGQNIQSVSDKDVINILLVGTDSRKPGNRRSRSDTMIIVSIDKKNKRFIMTSVLRDTYVNIPRVGRNRLNAAFVFGGPQLLLDTFDANFGIKLDKYVHLDFYNFIKIVDAIGGIDVNVSSAEMKIINKDYMAYVDNAHKNAAAKDKLTKAGTVHLNGAQALTYSRIRHLGQGDFGRTERQRKVMTAIISKARKMSLSELNKLADVVLPMVSTNLSQGDVMGLLMNASSYLNYNIVSARMPINGSYRYLTIRKASVLGVDFNANRKYWYKLVYGK